MIPAEPNNRGFRGVSNAARNANETAPQLKHQSVAIISQVFRVSRAVSFRKKNCIA